VLSFHRPIASASVLLKMRSTPLLATRAARCSSAVCCRQVAHEESTALCAMRRTTLCTTCESESDGRVKIIEERSMIMAIYYWLRNLESSCSPWNENQATILNYCRNLSNALNLSLPP
jgi:hypothetical protein